MTQDLKEAFRNEQYISTESNPNPVCKLWHSIGMSIRPNGISIFNVNLNEIIENGGKAESVKSLKELLRSSGFKKVKNEDKYTAPANISNFDKGIMIISDFDVKMDPETKKMVYWWLGVKVVCAICKRKADKVFDYNEYRYSCAYLDCTNLNSATVSTLDENGFRLVK